MTSYQDELMLLAFALILYVYDSAILIYFDEGILFPASRNKWAMWIGSEAARFCGKYLFIPNPLMPQRPLYRLGWQTLGSSNSSLCEWEIDSIKYRALSPLILGMGVGLFIFLPAGLLMRTTYSLPTITAALVVVYVNMAAALTLIWIRRQQFQISNRLFARLAFESLVCPPCALNLIRKLSLLVQVKEDLIEAAERLVSSDRWAVVSTKLLARIDEEIEGEAPESQRMVTLRERRSQLAQRPTS